MCQQKNDAMSTVLRTDEAKNHPDANANSCIDDKNHLAEFSP
jgi:hypothetical protein